VGLPLIVAIDGPAGAGKSSVTLALAQRVGFTLVDTGALYRCVALMAQREGAGVEDDAALARVVAAMVVSFHLEGGRNEVMLGADSVTESIRQPEISRMASQVSARPVVRAGLLGVQRRLAAATTTGAILEGRDIGTVVFPNAELKVFLSADPRVRALRRQAELHSRGLHASLEEVLAAQNRRDQEDAERAVAPLRAAPDAVRLDSTAMTVAEVVERLAGLVAERLKARELSG
jgi:cytidylate kinase